MPKPLVTIVLGTRPEAIKLAPVILAFQQATDFRTRVVLTGQHREMVSQVMDLFGLTADQDLALMAPKQTLTHVTCATLTGLKQDFADHPPDLVLVQGDTTTAFASALAAFYEQIPVGHVDFPGGPPALCSDLCVGGQSAGFGGGGPDPHHGQHGD